MQGRDGRKPWGLWLSRTALACTWREVGVPQEAIERLLPPAAPEA